MGLDNYYSGKRILVTGASGTVGSELVKQLLLQDVTELRIVDNNEERLFFLDENYSGNGKLNCVFGDIRDEYKMNEVTKDIDYVFHAAALKHVPICERAPFDAVMSNIIGVQNVLRASLNNDVGRVIFTSTDKAVNPTNVMGTSKLMGERLITAANNYAKGSGIAFSSTRFGNVLASRGSVIQAFYQQIKNGGPVRLTDKGMTRFIMTIEESVRLVLAAGRLARGGEIFVPKMQVIRIVDLARVMIDMFAPMFGYDPDAIEVKIVGSRPGEKLYEELMTGEEASRAIELEDLFSILPAFSPLYKDIEYNYSGKVSERVKDAYDSETQPALTLDELRAYLQENDVTKYCGA